MNKPTLVSVIYDIRKRENLQDSTEKPKDMNLYFDLSKELLQLDLPLVIFCESESNEKIKDLRGNLPLQIINIPFEEITYYNEYLKSIERLYNRYIVRGRNPVKDTILYHLLTYLKLYFMKKAIKKNYFDSEKFIFIDFGISHVAQNLNDIYKWIDDIPDKIKLMEINPYFPEEGTPYEYFMSYNHHSYAGGLMTGSGDYFIKFSEYFRIFLKEMFENNMLILEEDLYALIVNKHPEIFVLYYGDYTGIISNYNNCILNYNIVLTNLIKCIRHGKHQRALGIIDHLKPNFLKEKNFLYWYIILHYYTKGNILDQSLIDFLESEMENNKNFIAVYKDLKHNLGFYSNTKHIVERLG